jgi:TolA-binding protein
LKDAFAEQERIANEKAEKFRKKQEEEAREQAANAKLKADADEKDAATALQLAQELLRANKKAKAIERLEKIISAYPNTQAAKKAGEMLKTIDK